MPHKCPIMSKENPKTLLFAEIYKGFGKWFMASVLIAFEML